MFHKLKPKSEFSRNVLTLMTGTAIAQAVPIAISPVLTRLYAPEEFGVFSLFVAIVGFFSTVSSGRYEMSLFLPNEDRDAFGILVLSFFINFFFSLFLFFSIVIGNEWVGFLFKDEAISFWMVWVPLAVFFVGFFNQLNIYCNRKKYYDDIARASILKAVTAAAIQLTMGLAKSGVSGLIFGQIGAQLVAWRTLVKSVSIDSKYLKNLSRQRVVALARRYIDFPKFQLPHAMLNTLSSNMPIFLFSMFLDITSVGLYALSTRIVLTPMMMFATANSKVYSQVVAHRLHDRESVFDMTVELLKKMTFRSLPLFILFAIFSPEIFAYVFGEEWAKAGVYTQILSPWLFMVYLVTTISYVPSLLELQKKALKLEILYAFLRLVSMGFGLYFFNEIMALFLFSIAGFVMLGYNLYWLLKSLKGVS